MGNCPPASGFGALVWVALCEVVECARALDSMRALDSVLFESWLCVCESVGVDSVNALDCESALVSPSSILLRFCPCPFFRISLDSMRVTESIRLDSVNVLDSESTLDSVDSLFLRVVFSRIFPRFSKSLCFFAKRGVIPSPLAKAPKKPPLFRQPQSISFGGRASLFPLLAQSLRRHYCLLVPTIAHHEAGEGRLVLAHLHIDLIFALQKWQNLKIENL